MVQGIGTVLLFVSAFAELLGNSVSQGCAGAETPFHSGPGLVILHSRVNEVRIAFSVSNGRGKAVTMLTRDDITVRSQNQTVTAITSFDRADNLPLQLALVVDASGSMQETFAEERLAAQKLLKRMVRPQVDDAFVVGFATKALVKHGAINGESATPLQDLQSDGQTALYDTLHDVARGLEQTQGQEPTRRVIILLSDGEDNWGRHNLDEVIAAAQQADAAIFAITAHSRRYEFPGDHVLQQLAEATGGKAFVVRHYDKLDKVFAVIEAALRTHYIVGFRPPSVACGFHDVSISVRGKSKVRARSGYYVGMP